jgi:hypothetical protein
MNADTLLKAFNRYSCSLMQYREYKQDCFIGVHRRLSADSKPFARITPSP